jgi:hypothetical protein
MAQSLETLRSSKIKSIYGRELGIDKDGYLVGAPDLKKIVEDLTTSTGATIAAYGVARILTSGSSQGPVQYNLPAPVPGVEKTICLISTSTGSHQFLSTPAGASIFNATAGTTANAVNMVGPGGSVTLIGLTTAIWGVKGQAGSTASGGMPTYSTST